MTKKIAALLFIPIFFMLYYASNSNNTTLGTIGIILFIFVAGSQIMIRK
ncbi:MAG: hypothetical protein XD91_0457 [Clostridiales bacterium 38_11]|nr:MAG: hypothetical protein XD91_0457 [Clostridiales bacterium 38_11]